MKDSAKQALHSPQTLHLNLFVRIKKELKALFIFALIIHVMLILCAYYVIVLPR